MQLFYRLFSACCHAPVSLIRHHTYSSRKPVNETFLSLELRSLIISWSEFFYVTRICVKGCLWSSELKVFGW